jgi:hypothetical protein
MKLGTLRPLTCIKRNYARIRSSISSSSSTSNSLEIMIKQVSVFSGLRNLHLLHPQSSTPLKCLLLLKGELTKVLVLPFYLLIQETPIEVMYENWQ